MPRRQLSALSTPRFRQAGAGGRSAVKELKRLAKRKGLEEGGCRTELQVLERTVLPEGSSGGEERDSSPQDRSPRIRRTRTTSALCHGVFCAPLPPQPVRLPRASSWPSTPDLVLRRRKTGADEHAEPTAGLGLHVRMRQAPRISSRQDDWSRRPPHRSSPPRYWQCHSGGLSVAPEPCSPSAPLGSRPGNPIVSAAQNVQPHHLSAAAEASPGRRLTFGDGKSEHHLAAWGVLGVSRGSDQRRRLI